MSRLTIIRDGIETDLQYHFTDEEYELLEMYLKQCDALEKCEWFKKQHLVALTLEISEDSPFNPILQNPPDDVVAAVLHRVRPFVLQREPASFLKMTNLVGKRIDDPYIHSFLKQVRASFFSEKFKSTMKITLTAADPNDPEKPIQAVLNDFQTFLDWLNSYEYHQDRDKRRRLESLTNLITPAAARTVFLGMLKNVTAASFSLGNLISALTGQTNEFTFTGSRPKEVGSEGPHRRQTRSTAHSNH